MLVECKTCKKDVSINAKMCPHCGETDFAPSNYFAMFFWLAVILLIVASMAK